MNAINYLGVNGNSPSLFNNTDPENRFYPNNDFSYQNNKINSFDKINVDNESYLENPTQPNISKVYSNVDMAVSIIPLPPNIKTDPKGTTDITVSKDRKDFNNVEISDIGKGFEYYPNYGSKFNFGQKCDKPYNHSFIPELKNNETNNGTITMYQTEQQFNDNRNIGPVIPSMTIEQYNNCLPTINQQIQDNIYLKNKDKIEGFKNIDNNYIFIFCFIIIMLIFINRKYF